MGILRPWKRPLFTPGGERARLDLHCFASDPLTQPCRPSLHDGLPLAWAGRLEPEVMNLEDDPAWFDTFFGDKLRAGAEAAMGKQGERIKNIQWCYSIVADIPDPADLTHLQAAWATVRALMRCGCFLGIDGGPIEWFAGKTVLSWRVDRPFLIEREAVVVFEVAPNENGMHVVHTRGMAKFGRPDLVIPAISPDELGSAEKILTTVANELALGRRLGTDDLIAIDGFSPIRVQAYEPDRNAPDITLANDGLVLPMPTVDETAGTRESLPAQPVNPDSTA